MPKAAGLYAAKMLIKNHCPMCETIMSEMERIAREVNQFTLDQCSMAQNIAGSMVSKLANGDKQRCMMRSNINKSDKDLFGSTEKCSNDPDSNKDAGKDELDSLLGDEFNLVWKALTKSKKIDNTEFAEMIMSISGTIIGQKKGGRWEFVRKDSLFKDSKQLAALIGSFHDQAVKIYKCDDNSKCLNPTTTTINLGDKTLYREVVRIIKTLTPKIAGNVPVETLSADEQDLISFSSIPLINMIEQDLVLKGSNSDPLIANSEFVELICYDMIIEFLSKLVNIATSELQNVALGSNEPKLVQSFVKDVEQVKHRLYEHKMSAFQRVNIVLQAKENMNLQGQQLKSRFSRIMTTHIGGKNQ
jgi:hypothetical protein